MPIYEYRCQLCGHQFEKLVRFSKPDKKIECPNCHTRQVTKQISLFASHSSHDDINNSCASGMCQIRR